MNTLCLSAIAFAAAIALVSPSLAQNAPHLEVAVMKVLGPVKNAGTYHMATGTWTRTSNAVASFGTTNNVYSNTAMSGYYHPLIGPTGLVAWGIAVDEGVIPGLTNPTVFAGGGPLQEINEIVEFQFAYCDLDPAAGVAGWTFDFYESYAPCTFPPIGPSSTVIISGAPSNGCWVMTVDLSNATGAGNAFSMQADGGAAAPGFDGDPNLDSFGVSHRYTGTGMAAAGMFITGDPAVTDTGWLSGLPNTGSNTYFGEVGGCPGTGSGYGNWDSYWLEDTTGMSPIGSACRWFGGYLNNGSACGGSVSSAYGGFWLELTAGSSNALPIISSPECVGADTVTGAPAICEIYGSAGLTDNLVELRATGMPRNQFGLFLTGRGGSPTGVIPSGNGWICIDPVGPGGIGRLMGAGQLKSTGAGGEFTLGTQFGEWDLAALPSTMGTYPATIGMTSHFQAWFREPVGIGWNFSGSCSVTWM